MGDDDLIRRGDALKALDWGDIYGSNAQQCIRAIPAADARAKIRKEVMPNVEVDDPANARLATSPGVTAGAVRAEALKEAAAVAYQAAVDDEADNPQYIANAILALIPEKQP